MTDPDFQDAGEAYRQALGIDGTAADAQDRPHPFIGVEAPCIVCGLAESYSQHHKPGTPTAEEIRRRVEAIGSWDVWVDFNDIDGSGRIVTYADLIRPGHGPYGGGAAVTAGDGEGNRCPATVVEVTGHRLTLQLDLDRFEAGAGRRQIDFADVLPPSKD